MRVVSVPLISERSEAITLGLMVQSICVVASPQHSISLYGMVVLINAIVFNGFEFVRVIIGFP